jgi:hypothetical protein
MVNHKILNNTFWFQFLQQTTAMLLQEKRAEFPNSVDW